MQVSIRTNVLSANVQQALRQVEDIYGARFVGIAVTHPPFSLMGALAISPLARHPLLPHARVGRGSYHKPTNTYYVPSEMDYIRFASEDWAERIAAYTEAVTAAIAKVAKTRMSPDERATLQRLAAQVKEEVAAVKPITTATVGPIYVADTPSGRVTGYEPMPYSIAIPTSEIHLQEPLYPPHEERVFKLYARAGGALRYREAWILDSHTVVEHWGACGERGETRDHTCINATTARRTYDDLKAAAKALGFRPIAPSKHAKLVVEIPIDGMGTSGDLDRRHALEDWLDDFLGWVGLGQLDGGSTGSNTMEAFCDVVDFELAKSTIGAALRDTPFSDFTRIYRQK